METQQFAGFQCLSLPDHPVPLARLPLGGAGARGRGQMTSCDIIAQTPFSLLLDCFSNHQVDLSETVYSFDDYLSTQVMVL